MARMALKLCVGAVLFGGIVAAQDAQLVIPRGEIEILAREELPTGGQTTFEAEIKHLTDVLAAKVQYPAPAQYIHDNVLGHELKHVFKLLREWPAMGFRQPLTEYFSTIRLYEDECAEALLAYRDEELVALVKTHTGVFGRVGTARFDRQQRDVTDVVGKLRLWARRFDFHGPKPFDPLDSFLPESKLLGRLKWPDGITVDDAARQLGDRDLSIRLQSWAWLAERGIIAPTEDVVTIWPRLKYGHQDFISDLRPRFAGRQRLLKLFEKLALMSAKSGLINDALILGQVELGQMEPVTRARQILAGVPVGKAHDALWSETLALNVLAAAPGAEDVAILIKISRGGDEYNAGIAMDGLARIDNSEAIDEVGKYLAKPSKDFRYSIVVRTIQRQSIKELRHRNRYLDILASALCHAVEISNDQHERDWRPLQLLGEAFVCMSGQNFRDAVQAEKSQVITGQVVGASWNSSKGFQKFSRPIYQDNATSVAKVCLDWYSQ